MGCTRVGLRERCPSLALSCHTATPMSHLLLQSAGGFSISQKSPAGLSNSTPSSHRAPSTSERTSTILPFLLRPLEASSTVTGVSLTNSSRTITPHPCALTTTVSYCPENLHAGSRLVIRTGICRDSRVLRLASFLSPLT